jgi:hypothetical protein
MKKYRSNKKSKRKQLTRKNRRKTLNKKKVGGTAIDSSKSDGSIVIASGLTGIVFMIIILSIELNSSNGGAVDHAKIEKILLSSINTAIANDILLFLRNIDFKGNVLVIRNLPDKLIDEINGYIEQFNFLKNYITTANNTISLNFNNKIVLNAAIIEPYLDPLLDRISELDENNRINVDSIRQKIKILLK